MSRNDPDLSYSAPEESSPPSLTEAAPQDAISELFALMKVIYWQDYNAEHVEAVVRTAISIYLMIEKGSIWQS
ncbi:hypothetical protein FRB95_012054 [Tulasnella sp. JGI-2019a]|nr:hypothetical protein FRB93_010353 [Tulasnella sp. JGI-2019a]KAG9024119.1 hypothetical protein FRB95_012054 [Tulasnella sp. JGI-2019a]